MPRRLCWRHTGRFWIGGRSVLFWNAFPFLVPNKVGALAVNIIILGNWAGFWHWPSESMLGDQAAQAARTIT
jgi:hypothetical protein